MVNVSVIIPVYNTEKYLARCLESLNNQTLKDIEIICINDGSTDNSLAILEDYAKKDSRIKVISQDNAKQGAARNKGLDIAKGEFVAFVDSDDWVDKDYLEKLYNAAVKNNVNMAVGSTTRDYENNVKIHLKFTDLKIYTGANNIVKALKRHLVPHGKLYKLEFIKDLRYPEEVFYEDAPYVLTAIIKENSIVTVPEAHYHYYSNPNSTIKQNNCIKKENDKIEMNLLLLDIAKQNKVELENYAILKENHFLWKIKHYLDYKDYYLFGIKVYRKQIPFVREKTFVVFNTSYFGDVLLCDSLVQNIKRAFPKSKVVFVVNKGFEEVAKNMQGVDEVAIYDKKGENKGLFGLIKFIKGFKYKKPYASIVTYRNHRNYLIAKLINSKFVKVEKLNKSVIHSQVKHNNLLKSLTNRNIKNFPIQYNVPHNIENPVKEEKYITLCTTSKKLEKDMPIATAVELIKKINSETDYKVVFVGCGEITQNYSKELKNNHCEFIDLTDKTTIPELAKVLKNSKCLISIDTGTMHLGYAVGTPTLCLFYQRDLVLFWAPDKETYKNTKVISDNLSANNIFNFTQELINENEGVLNV